MQDHNPIPENEKPDCPLIGQDGNIFNLIGIASRTLKQNGMAEQAKEMANRIYACGSYGEALCIIGEYRVNPGLTDLFLAQARREYENSRIKKPSVRENLSRPQEQKTTEPTQKQRKTPER